jgi:hypothetical protein
LEIASREQGSDAAPFADWIEPDGTTIATDGHILAKFTPLSNPAGKEYPVIDGVNADDGENKLQPFTLSTEAATILLRALSKKTPRHLPILGNVALDVEQTNSNGFAVRDNGP